LRGRRTLGNRTIIFGIDQRLEQIEGIGLGYGVAELELRTLVG
jgi:hypothetical protein